MSYAVPASPGERRRPAVVTAAGYLLFLAALLLILGAVLPLPSLSKVVDATRQAYAGSTNPTPDDMANITRAGAIVSVVVLILVAVLLAVIGGLVLRGNRVGRILAWVFGGLGALCTVCGVSSNSLAGRFSTGNVNGVDVTKAQKQIDAARPSWLMPTTVTLEVITLLALILVIILLALPAAHPYFRKNQAGPVSDPGFPNLPYPPMPGGAPQPPAAPPASPAPPANPPAEGGRPWDNPPSA